MTRIDTRRDFGLLTAVDPATAVVTDLWPSACHGSNMTVDILSVSIHWALAYMLQVRTNSPIVLLGMRAFEEENGRALDAYTCRRNYEMRIERTRRFTTQALLAKFDHSYIECIFSSEGFDDSATRSSDSLWIAAEHMHAHATQRDLMMSYQELTAWLHGDWLNCRKVNDWMDLVLDAGAR